MQTANKIETETSTVETSVITAETTENVDNVLDYSVESTAERIQSFWNNISNDKLQIGFEIYNFKKFNKDNKEELNALQEATGLHREQFRKMQFVGEYCKTKSKKCHTCGNYEKLGFEKIYRINQLKRENLCVGLENFAIEKKLSVRLLEKLVMVLNKNITLTIEAAYESVMQEKEAARNQDTANQQVEAVEATELQETIKQQEEKIKELMESNKQKDEKIKQLEERNKQLEQELEEQKLLLQSQEEVPDDTEIQSNTQVVESVAKEEPDNSESDKQDVSVPDNTANVNENPSDNTLETSMSNSSQKEYACYETR